MIAASLVALGPAAATAQEIGSLDEAVGQVTSEVTKQVAPSTGSTGSTGGTTDAPSGTSSPEETLSTVTEKAPAQESSGTTTQSAEQAGAVDRSGSYAEAQVAEADVDGNDVVDVARSTVSIDDSDRARADATLLALGGQEIIGAHADSAGEKEAHAGDPLAPLCEGSEGQLCLRVLFADAYASEDADSSESLARTGLADACLGGDSADPRAECSGPVSAEVGTSSAQQQRDKTDGSTQGTAQSAVVDVCVGAEGATCAAGVEVLKARSFASSSGTTQGGSTVARLELGNEEVVSLSDPTNLEIQPECAEPSAVCVVANQGASAVNDGVASQTQDALNAGVLPDTVGIDLGLSGTGVVSTEGDPAGAVVPEPPGAGGPGAGGDGPGAGGPGAGGPGTPGNGEVAGVQARVLPNAGGIWSGLLAIAFGTLAAGSFLIARSRRRHGLPA